MLKDFFCRFFSSKKSRSTLDDDGEERIAAIPSIEDRTRSLPHWTIYIAWGCKFIQRRRNVYFSILFKILVIILSILSCSFFIILYSLEWGAQRANEWLLTMLLSFGQSILVIDPVKVFLLTAIISFLIRRPYNDETLDFNDPFMGALLARDTVAKIDDSQGYNNAKVKGLSTTRDAFNYVRLEVFFRSRSSTSCSFI